MGEKIHSIKAKITGEERAAPEGVWVQGGLIEVPCKYFLYAPKKYKSRVRNTLREKISDLVVTVKWFYRFFHCYEINTLVPVELL